MKNFPRRTTFWLFVPPVLPAVVLAATFSYEAIWFDRQGEATDPATGGVDFGYLTGSMLGWSLGLYTIFSSIVLSVFIIVMLAAHFVDKVVDPADAWPHSRTGLSLVLGLSGGLICALLLLTR